MEKYDLTIQPACLAQATICIHTLLQTYIHTYIHAYTHIHIHRYMYIHTYIHTSTNAYIYVCLHSDIGMHVMYVCMSVYICIYIHNMYVRHVQKKIGVQLCTAFNIVTLMETNLYTHFWIYFLIIICSSMLVKLSIRPTVAFDSRVTE